MKELCQQKREIEEDLFLCIGNSPDQNSCEAFIGFKSPCLGDEKETYVLTAKKYMVFTYKVDLAQIFETVLTDMCYTIMRTGVVLDQHSLQFYLRFSKDYFKSKEYQIYLPLL